MTARWARTARGWSVALLTAVLSAACHAAAGGGFPAPAVVLLAVLLSGLVSTALIGSRRSLPRLAGSVAAAQVIFHFVFTTFGPAGAVTIGHAGHAHHAGHGSLIGDFAGGLPGGSAQASPAMLFAHVAAGLASALLLAHGERALQKLASLAASVVRRLVPAPALRRLTAHRPVVAGRPIPIPHTTIRPGVLRYRGPPLALAA